jgi:hypothetical protein
MKATITLCILVTGALIGWLIYERPKINWWFISAATATQIIMWYGLFHLAK